MICANTAGELAELPWPLPGQAQAAQRVQLPGLGADPAAMLAEGEEAIGAPDSSCCCSRNASGGGNPHQFTLVVNSAFPPYKRLHLAAGVPGLAHIGYCPGGGYDSGALPEGMCLNTCDGDGRCCGGSMGNSESCAGQGCAGQGCAGQGPQPAPGAALGGSSTSWWAEGQGQGAGSSAPVYHYLQPAEVAAALKCCQVGGMFSEEEGTCSSSSDTCSAACPWCPRPAEVAGRSGTPATTASLSSPRR